MRFGAIWFIASVIGMPTLAIMGYFFCLSLLPPIPNGVPEFENVQLSQSATPLGDPIYSIVVRGVTYRELEGLTAIVAGAAVTISIPALAQEETLISGPDGSYRVIFSASSFPSGAQVEVHAAAVGYYRGASFGHLGENGNSQFIVLDVALRPLNIAPQLFLPWGRKG